MGKFHVERLYRESGEGIGKFLARVRTYINSHAWKCVDTQLVKAGKLDPIDTTDCMLILYYQFVLHMAQRFQCIRYVSLYFG